MLGILLILYLLVKLKKNAFLWSLKQFFSFHSVQISVIYKLFIHININILMPGVIKYHAIFSSFSPGILAMTNHVIPGEVYAWIAVVVLPINSALNPFLFTF